MNTLQGTNISHLGKRKIIFKMPFLGDMLVPWRVIMFGIDRSEMIWIVVLFGGGPAIVDHSESPQRCFLKTDSCVFCIWHTFSIHSVGDIPRIFKPSIFSQQATIGCNMLQHIIFVQPRFLLSYAFSFASFFLLVLLPSQKQEAQRRLGYLREIYRR